MSRRSKHKHTKAERRRAARETVSTIPHLLLQGWSNTQSYQQWWKRELKNKNMAQQTNKKVVTYTPVHHDEILPLPWKWAVATLDPETGARVVTKSNNRAAPASLHVQGETVFLGRNGYVQKLTTAHNIVVQQGSKEYQEKPYEIALWVEDNENTLRKEEAMKTGNKRE